VEKITRDTHTELNVGEKRIAVLHSRNHPARSKILNTRKRVYWQDTKGRNLNFASVRSGEIYIREIGRLYPDNICIQKDPQFEIQTDDWSAHVLARRSRHTKKVPGERRSLRRATEQKQSHNQKNLLHIQFSCLTVKRVALQ
jgi:hypothetical protein